ncbi:HAMP domain-containing protein [Streptomyces sp. CA-251387]|uniref:hybrid sensor histidine kinase/response regulator n=1 Tax=Streptomyces sp. CA-251387 TaxID=3240064 RepID=UPI003D906086
MSQPPGDGWARTSDLRPLLAAMTALRDGDFRSRLPVQGEGVVNELSAIFNQIVDRNEHFTQELARVRREIVRQGRLDERLSASPGQGAWTGSVVAANTLLDALVVPMANATRVLDAVAGGDLTQRVDLHDGNRQLRGDMRRLGRGVNHMVDQLSLFADEVTRVAREVGIEGRLGGRAKVRGLSGSWRDVTEAVNTMATRLTAQVRDIAVVTTSVARGDLTRSVTVEATGELLELKLTVNTMVDQLSAFADEVTRVAREVGTEGQLGGQAHVRGVSGVWKDLTDNVNFMASNLTSQVRNIAQVTTSVANGDLSQKITVDAQGEILQLKSTVNTMVDQLSAFADEVTRVAREVGTEGQLGGQAHVRGVSGVWKDLTDNVNFMASNLTSQVRNIAQVTTSVANGDLSQKITVDAQGEILQLKSTVNTMVDQLSAFADEVTRVAREVGTEGHLGGQAHVRGVSGVWKDLTDNVNFMASNLTSQVRNIAQVTTSVANGDLSQKITVDAQGEILQLKSTVNTMVDQLSAFADEVTRVAREVGTEGNLGGQAHVRGVSGVWKDLTDNVNFMASNLTSQVRNIAQVATAVALGDLGKKIDVDARGEILELKTTINTMVDTLSSFSSEVTRVAREVGSEGQLGGQAHVRGVSGVWKDLTDNVNFMADNLTSQVRNIAQVTTSVANGDLSQKITVDAQGEILQLKSTVNTMVDQLSAFADEVTRVAHEVGTEGNLGGQAHVRGVSGVWKDLTDNVNFMADNLTSQVRNIAQVATAVALGDLGKKIDVDARGEILELKTTINTMVDTLSSFSSEVTRVAREVGSEGQLGGQARVEGVHGTWKSLTTSVNSLALNLTTQVRAIAEVASAVSQGDLSRSIAVEASGEVAELKNNVNLMVSKLRETTRAKDWLESNLARLAGLMQGHRDLREVAELILRELTPLVNAQFGAFFLADVSSGDGSDVSADRTATQDRGLAFIAGYGSQGATVDPPGMLGHGLVRQAALEKKRILVEEAPPDYIKITSGLGEAAPASVVIIPILFENTVLGIIELASFSRFSDVHLAFFDQFVNTIGVAINTIIANSRTEALLGESQRLAMQLQERSDELQSQQAELQRSNAELEEKAALLASSSQYKSDFLANMSHELRTPLNSLLILARLLSENPEGHLTDQEVQFATTIYRSGSDLLQLINDILDLSKVEAGRMDVRPKRLPLAKLVSYVSDTFRPIAIDRGLAFEIAVGEDVLPEIYSDEQRLQQILRNLLSNAIKFTSRGRVTLRVERCAAPPYTLKEDSSVIAFIVEDTGIGIPGEKLSSIFEAFEQAERTTNRKYGGTGLGLSISRELATLLGGKIVAESEQGKGSIFTLYIPAVTPGFDPDDPAGSEPDATEQEVTALDPRPALRDFAAAPVSWQTSVAQGDACSNTKRLEEWTSGRPGRVLSGSRVLIIDDDIRMVFALTQALGRAKMPVLYAENGKEGIEVLRRNPDVAIVLMDIMMPEMDGYQTIEEIRSTPRYADLPIIAVTAKAIPGDREEVITRGANEYVPKPVDIDLLLGIACDLLDPEGAAAASHASDNEEDTTHQAAGDTSEETS